MTNSKVNCEVIVSDEGRLGEFANAFRVLADAGDEVFLDFCVYSARENIAKVVSRVRIKREFLRLLQDRLRESLLEFGDESITVRNGLLIDHDGSVLVPSQRIKAES